MPSIYAFAGALMLSAVAAQQGDIGEDGPNNSTTPTTVENEITIHLVTVGYYPDAFQPNSINANPGDIVMFKIYPGNHTVIESLYGWPCIPQSAVNGQQGFYSGVYPNATTDDPAVWNYTVTHTGPTFYYCGAPGSCINYGMLGVINPDNSTNLTAQIDLAKASRYYLEPNQTLPAAAAASISALASTILASPSSTPAHNSSSSSLSSGAIAGIAVGGAVVLALIGALTFWLLRKRRQVKKLEETVNRQSVAPSAPLAPPEMTVDGITYVPTYDSRASVQKTGFLPPYSRSRSPETVSNYGAPMGSPGMAPTYGAPMGSPGFAPHSPGMHSTSRFSEHSDFTFHAPQPLPMHELGGHPILREEENVDVERGPPEELSGSPIRRKDDNADSERGT